MARITTHYKGDMLFESKLGDHSVTIDVPAGMGGANRGPTPPELFVASLGSCVGAFVVNYCNNAGIDATDASVDVTFEKTDDPVRLTNMRVDVNVPHADLTGREKAILRVAEHCPVHETICTWQDVDMVVNGKSV